MAKFQEYGLIQITVPRSVDGEEVFTACIVKECFRHECGPRYIGGMVRHLRKHGTVVGWVPLSNAREARARVRQHTISGTASVKLIERCRFWTNEVPRFRVDRKKRVWGPGRKIALIRVEEEADA